MLRRNLLSLGLGVLCASGLFAQDGEKKIPKLLVITESKGFVHEVVKRPAPDKFCIVEEALTKLGKDTGDFEAVCSQDSRKAITAENLKQYDAVFFYTTGDLPWSETQKADLLNYVKSGKGFTGSHCATDTFYGWTPYGDMIGGYFDGHPWHTKVNVVVEDRTNPATKHLGESFEITDELYQFRTPKVGQSVPGGAGAGRDGRDHWAKVFSCIVAGGGFKKGLVHGSSDRYAAEPSTSPVRPADLVATLYHQLGVDPHTIITDRLGREIPLVSGEVLTNLIG